MARELRNIGASVRARVEQTDFQILLTRYALERLLYRLSVSDQREVCPNGCDALRNLAGRSLPTDP